MLDLAKREGMEKVYTLVERDEVGTWAKLGFAKEGAIPGFYKRSDAYLLGCSVDEALARDRERPRVPMQSEIRISIRGRLAHTTPVPPPRVEDDEDEDDVPESMDDSAHRFAEKTIVHAKKHAKGLARKPIAPAKAALPLREAGMRRSCSDKALKSRRARWRSSLFGRDVERRRRRATCRPAKSAPCSSLVASTESQSCFGNAFLELLTAPRDESESLATDIERSRRSARSCFPKGS